MVAIGYVRFFYGPIGSQIDDMSESHEASLMEMEKTHNDTLVTLREENTRTVNSTCYLIITLALSDHYLLITS